MTDLKTIVTNILRLKRSINDILRDKLYIKDFSTKLTELLYELDDYSEIISVDILYKTDLHKTLKIILQLSDAYLDLKESCYKILDNIFQNISKELFLFDDSFNLLLNQNRKYKNNIDIKKLNEELDKLIKERNNCKYCSDFIIKTDEKTLEKIMKDELNMLLESRRRQNTRRFESTKMFNFYINDLDKINSNPPSLSNKFKNDNLSPNIKKRKQNNSINIDIDKKNLSLNQNAVTFFDGNKNIFPEITKEKIDKDNKQKNLLKKKVNRKSISNINIMKNDKVKKSKSKSSKKMSLNDITENNIKNDKNLNKSNTKKEQNKKIKKGTKKKK